MSAEVKLLNIMEEVVIDPAEGVRVQRWNFRHRPPRFGFLLFTQIIVRLSITRGANDAD